MPAPAHTPRRRFGQHFLTDAGIIDRIVAAIAPSADDCIVEIGPGLGALTRPLLEALPRLHAVELDRDIVARLGREFPAERLLVHAADALKFDFARLGPRFRVVGNLPYNISTPLLFHLARFADAIIDIHVMLQKEVVDRMAADPGTSDYGRLSVMLQYRFSIEKLFDVPPEAFRPPPKVDSAVVRLTPFERLPFPAKDEHLFAALVAAAFSQRRKTLRNTLKGYLGPEALARLGIDPQLRAENLSVEQFVRAANHLCAPVAATGTTPEE
ncbi:MAG: 16S rRNA (adenine(1518)-N(6)/adenine(1519)-N(6))-dimethyltransferase RsmA [Betaproteobacteria bacterium]|nr:16S rRNA (adenine(1518)-N(6)/adenine(1519)-N(6))-dimethyltransferase RsmA [Betaproteobacteria bacterium]